MQNVVYLLLSRVDFRTYIGSTNNIKRRLDDHNLGKVRSTKNRRPLELIYGETLPTLEEARFRERYLKTKKGRLELKIIFERLNLDNSDLKK